MSWLRRVRGAAAPAGIDVPAASGPVRTNEPAGPVARRVDAILRDAVHRRASDVHVDPLDGGCTRVRLRVDGRFEDGPPVDAGLHDRIVARLKVQAGLAVYRREDIQEGSIRLDGGIDLRLSVVPTVRGEKATLRIFDPRTRPFRVEELGFRDYAREAVARLAELGHGTVLVCGPAGAGKTTTLYALLARIVERRGDDRNICSVEDPVEYALDGVHQVPVRREGGVTFARALAALLRQDPGVLLVGEVRDPETAAIAVEAGMTGHLVLSSVHAGRAAEALVRLVDLGVEPYLVGGSLRGVVAQRLVRRVCAACAEPDPDAPERLDRLALDGPGDWTRGAGCPACRGTGYDGRLPLVEVLEVDDAVARAVVGRSGARDLEARLLGGRSLRSEGIAAARAGRTSLEELSRAIEREEAPR